MDVTKIFGSNVFNDAVMRRWLPKDTYKILKKTIELRKLICLWRLQMLLRMP